MSGDPASALSKFLGQGSAHEGAHHWRAQRLSAVALVPLTLWFLCALLTLPDYSYETLRGWFAHPWRALLMSLLVACSCWHSQLGVQVVIEDYVHGRAMKPFMLMVNAYGHALLGAAGVFAVILFAAAGG
jgi:succinate dehydrogenase / fumarate reductase, membrane anchor subunit